MNAVRHRRGFVMLMSVGMVGLVSVVMLGLALFLRDDSRHTDEVARQAQLDQLLLAGAALAGEHPDQPARLAFPEMGASLAIAPTPQNGEIHIVITASHDGQTATQTLVLRRSGDRWTVVAATR